LSSPPIFPPELGLFPVRDRCLFLALCLTFLLLLLPQLLPLDFFADAPHDPVVLGGRLRVCVCERGRVRQHFTSWPSISASISLPTARILTNANENIHTHLIDANLPLFRLPVPLLGPPAVELGLDLGNLPQNPLPGALLVRPELVEPLLVLCQPLGQSLL